ncbi:MAG: Do family serine endopeptidase, partial [Bacteroidota bacterium]
VVQIQSSRRVERSSNGQMRFFEEFFGRRPDGQERDEFQLQAGLGSGVIVRDDGFIVTNNHVVEDADELEVVLYDGRTLDATIVGTDPLSDLAVIKVDGDDFPFVTYGDSDDLRVGQWVMAFGSPLARELSNTVTAGIVSALGRFSNSGEIEDYVQTDAAINPGNSGGALVNLRGELIGINKAIYSRSGGSQGIGLAIPVNTVVGVVDQLIDNGEVRRGYLGVSFAPVTESLARATGAPRGAARIADVQAGLAADRAGLEIDDIIVAVDGRELVNSNQLLSMIATRRPGDEVDLEIIRDERRRTVTVELGTRVGDEVAANGNNDRQEEERDENQDMEKMKDDLGLTLQTLTGTLARELDLEVSAGVLVADVSTSSEAFRDADIRRNDIIVQIDKQDVENTDDFAQIYRSIEAGDTFLVRVQRGANGFLTALTKPE